MNELTKWVITELSSLLQFPVTEDMAKCILMIESNRDLEEYMKTLVDFSNPTHQKFVKDLLKKKYLSEGYKKSKLEDYTEPSEKKDKKKSKAKNDPENKKNDQEEHGGKKKTKYVSIFSEDRQVVLLKGRHVCNCQASKHGLINNCLKCGRIVCEQEGSGPCFFCSHPVYTREELKKNPQLMKISSVLVPDSSLENAMELKERLLDYDKSSERRTRVIDDENDYFSTNSVWLSKQMKEELRKKEENLQELKHTRARSLIFDFTGRCIIDDEFKKLNLESSLLEEVTDLFDNSYSQEPFQNDNIDPKSTLDIEPIYEGDISIVVGARWHNSMGRVQDKQVMEMTDSGQCLSMHQPWATLLVEGIKIACPRPTIICVPRAKPARPPPPGDHSPPMPSGPPPPPPPEVLQVHVNGPDLPPRPVSPYKVPGDSQQPICLALYDYESSHTDDLDFKTGEKITVIGEETDEWLRGRLRGREGIFPKNYVRIMSKPPQKTLMWAIALFPFIAQSWDDLDLKEGDRVKVLDRVNQDWLYGECGGRQGQFPESFIQDVTDFENGGEL